VAGLFKQLRFAGVSLVTLAEGEISELHVGLKGTMNALFLKTSPPRRTGASTAVWMKAVRPAVSATATARSANLIRVASQSAVDV
jgi:hypothetical protein